MRFFLMCGLALCLAKPVSAAKLNVVFILVDDWGWADAGVQGSDFFETPNIDRLAREGMRFTQAYAAAAICSPTRAAILTGKSPARLDMTIWHEGAVRGGSKNKRLLEAKAVANLPLAEVTLAELFKKQNYFTAHIGKWHLGKAAFYPETQGYDVNIGGTFWGAPSTFHWPYRGPWGKNDPELRYVPVGPGMPGDYLTDKLTDHALRIIAEQKDRPFFLSLWFHTVHTPIEGKPALVKRFEKKPAGKIHSHAEYAAMLASLDENIGRVLRQLDDLKLADQTVVILTSDNGGVDFPTAKSGNRPPTRNAPFRSGKGTLYEGGLRVPLIIRWPGETPAGKVSSQPTANVDFYPTLLKAIGVAPDKKQTLDGVSMLNTWRDPEAAPKRAAMYWHYPLEKPHFLGGRSGGAIRSGSWKLIEFFDTNKVELFHLDSDPSEKTNLAAQRPNKRHELHTQLIRWRKSVGATKAAPKR